MDDPADMVTPDDFCAREPIRFPGSIQPHGALLAVDPAAGFRAVAVSANAAALLGGFLDPRGMIGQEIGDILGRGFFDLLKWRFEEGRIRAASPWQSTVVRAGRTPKLDVAVHLQAGLIIIECERASVQNEIEAFGAARQLLEAITDLQEQRQDLEMIARITARGMRTLLGYERALIYRFDAGWNGEAIAEDKSSEWKQSLAGLHFPASDIPAQARELYRESMLRWVPDVDAVPVPLLQGAAARPVDLSFAQLRALSPVHMQYHRNMGVNGSMSLSILHEDRLWGLVVCHHRWPHNPSVGQRAAAAALTNCFAAQAGTAERAGTERARQVEMSRFAAVLANTAEADSITQALTAGDLTIETLFRSTGAAVLDKDVLTLLGRTPPEEDVRLLAGWIRTRRESGSSYHTESLAAFYPAGARYSDIASGVLAVFLSSDRSDMLIWFRPEEPQLVAWGGNPAKQAGPDRAIMPRLSFERWVEARRGISRPWLGWELDLAGSLRHGITNVMVRSLRRITDLNDKLRQSQKMEAVGQLTGGIAHDFNNLLTGIIGSLDMVRLRIRQARSGELDRYLDAATDSAERAAALIDRLLSFARRQTLDPRRVDVIEHIHALEDLIRRTLGPGNELETILPADVWQTLCDGNQLDNALLNLAINARDAMPDGGHMTIEAANIHLDEARGRDYEVAAGFYVVLSVTDSGVGMEPDVMARVFEPFFTTKPLGEGTGLGLSMVYGFAKQSSGYIGIYSEPGQGTTVRIYLPRYLGAGLAEAALLKGPALRPADAGLHAGSTVLVVDDESVIRLLVREVLQDLGFTVIEAEDGPTGLSLLQSAQRVDLLVTDVGLPGLNGKQLADAARMLRPGLKVLFITGYAANAAIGKGMLAPGMEILTKPFSLDVLAAKISAMV
jgi:light-regulated signal transduction histidine kinase (bacteriophytochrome)